MIKSIFLALSLLVLISGCSKTDDAGTSDFISDAGILHNQLLDNYYQNRVNRTPGTDEMLAEVVSLSSEYLLSRGYDQESVKEAESMLEENYSSSNLKSVMNEDFSIDVVKLQAQFEEMEKYSNRFIEDISKVLTMVAEEAALTELVNYVNSNYAGIEYANAYDQEGQSLFVNIFNSSCEYWTGQDSSNLKYLELDDTSKVIINDGIGGIIGLIFGPAGSIITATAFSVGTNEELKNESD